MLFSGAAIDGSVGEYWNLHGNAIVQIAVTTATVAHENEESEETNDGETEGREDTTEEEIDPNLQVKSKKNVDYTATHCVVKPRLGDHYDY